ncbi:MAG: efflux RND transporter periplasmic adaptor subunit [Thermonemataceae bacterium]
MRKIIFGISGVLFLLITGWLINYFIQQSTKDPTVYNVETPFDTIIVKKTVATGSILPRKEVQIKPPVSGVIQALYVEAGQPVKEGELIAKIQLVQTLDGLNRDQLSITSSQNSLETARINYKNAQQEYDRNKQLYKQKVISTQEFQRVEADLKVQKEAFIAAQNTLSLTRQGAVQRSGGISNNVYSTVDGIVLDVPLKAGASVIERSNFNEGTSIATIADMNSLVFEGKIDESEVAKLEEGMRLNLTIGAIPDKVFRAELEHIAPKGVDEEGAIKFNIRAKILLGPDAFIRAGYSANADIVLDKKEGVMAIKESWIEFEGEKAYIYIEKEPQQFVKKRIKTGISDGINIEVVDGLTRKSKVRGTEKKERPNENPKES